MTEREIAHKSLLRLESLHSIDRHVVLVHEADSDAQVLVETMCTAQVTPLIRLPSERQATHDSGALIHVGTGKVLVLRLEIIFSFTLSLARLGSGLAGSGRRHPSALRRGVLIIVELIEFALVLVLVLVLFSR